MRQQHRLRLILTGQPQRGLPARTAILATLVLSALVLAPGASASVRCTHSAEPQDELRVIPYEDPKVDLDFPDGTVARRGNRVVVLDIAGKEVKCSGPTATVANTATVLFLQGGLSFNTLDLSGGLPAPHVEFRSELGALAFGIVTGTEGADDWHLGGSATAIGLAIEPTAPLDQQVTWDGLGTNLPNLETGGGDDRVDASAVQRRQTTTLIEGGAGNDTLLGSPFEDVIDGGPGRDVLSGGAGNDVLDGRDGDHDRLDCGAGGRDRAQPGRGDSVKSCEKVERAGHHRVRPPKAPGLPPSLG